MRLEYARKLDAEKYANDRTVPLTDEQRAEMEAQKAQKRQKEEVRPPHNEGGSNHA